MGVDPNGRPHAADAASRRHQETQVKSFPHSDPGGIADDQSRTREYSRAIVLLPFILSNVNKRKRSNFSWWSGLVISNEVRYKSTNILLSDLKLPVIRQDIIPQQNPSAKYVCAFCQYIIISVAWQWRRPVLDFNFHRFLFIQIQYIFLFILNQL